MTEPDEPAKPTEPELTIPNVKVISGHVTVSQQLLDDGAFIAPMWLIGEYGAVMRPTPEQLAHRDALRAERERRRAEWWASLTRRARFRHRLRTRKAGTLSAINGRRTRLACVIAPWLDRDDDY